MDDYNSHGFIAVMYSQPKAYAGKNYINFSAIFSFGNHKTDQLGTWETDNVGMDSVLGMTEDDYNLITKLLYPIKNPLVDELREDLYVEEVVK